MEISKRIRADIGQGTDKVLTVSLIGLAVFTLFIAFFAPRLVKAGVLAWELFP